MRAKPIHSVAPNTLVTECVRTMTGQKIGALVVMDGEKLVGIFTERDALNKVLAAGLEPGKTKVCEVMTKDPYSIPPTTTVGDAMELVTKPAVPAPTDCGKRKGAGRHFERRSNPLAGQGPGRRGSRAYRPCRRVLRRGLADDAIE